MTQEQTKKIEELRQKIASLNVEINKCEAEIDNIIVGAENSFDGSYVCFYNAGEEFIFMKVEKQYNRTPPFPSPEESPVIINLQGPAIRMSANPLLDDEDEYDSVDCAEYNEWDGITFGPKVLQGTSANTIERITKKQMETVLDFYFRNVKENLL
jgi:hypothetical protein